MHNFSNLNKDNGLIERNALICLLNGADRLKGQNQWCEIFARVQDKQFRHGTFYKTFSVHDAIFCSPWKNPVFKKNVWTILRNTAHSENATDPSSTPWLESLPSWILFAWSQECRSREAIYPLNSFSWDQHLPDQRLSGLHQFKFDLYISNGFLERKNIWKAMYCHF